MKNAVRRAKKYADGWLSLGRRDYWAAAWAAAGVCPLPYEHGRVPARYALAAVVWAMCRCGL